MLVLVCWTHSDHLSALLAEVFCNSVNFCLRLLLGFQKYKYVVFGKVSIPGSLRHTCNDNILWKNDNSEESSPNMESMSVLKANKVLRKNEGSLPKGKKKHSPLQ